MGMMVPSGEAYRDNAGVGQVVFATVNASYKRDITASTLTECLLREDADDWLVHVATFFTDVSPALILSFAASHGITKVKLKRAYLAVKSKTGEVNLDLESMLDPAAT